MVNSKIPVVQKDLEEISGWCHGRYGMKVKHWKLSKPGKNRKKGEKKFKGDRGIGKKQSFLLLAGRCVFSDALTQVSSIKGEFFA